VASTGNVFIGRTPTFGQIPQSGNYGGKSELLFFPEPKIIAEGFKDLSVVVKSYRQPLTETVGIMTKAIKTAFDTEGAHGGQNWQPLSQFTTIPIKKWRGYENKNILQESGALRRSASAKYMWEIKAGAKDGSITWDIDNLRGTNRRGRAVKQYGLVHFFGFDEGSGWFKNSETAQTPARPYVFVTEGTALRIEHIFRQWYFQKINQMLLKGFIGPGLAGMAREDIKSGGILTGSTVHGAIDR
jgi:phage gpG-like protein